MASRKWKDIIKVEPLGWSVHVVRPSTLADFANFLLSTGAHRVLVAECHNDWEESLESGGAMFTEWNGTYIMALPDEFVHELVYHEALHCAIRLWADAGAKLALPDNEEVLTYTQGYIVRLLVAKFYKQPRNIEGAQ